MRCFVSGVVSPAVLLYFLPSGEEHHLSRSEGRHWDAEGPRIQTNAPLLVSSNRRPLKTTPLHYMHTAHTFHTYINKYQLHSAEYRDSVGCFGGSEGLSLGRLYIWLDGEGQISASMKEVLYRCYTVRSNLSSCFPIFFFFLILVNSVFKVSVFVLFSLYM